ncbi:hypothetical protein QBC38DRAFT_364914 [Podospora fimiseda]|uniref:Uncharacterized protein n=1 Tax=Podospora fimiseda TaxID=252190 RepID=A0AAN7BP44_9PEZI|nr:hypothetical protein QBC38DRAFT_364914 [Podospora fimiseda]
MTSSVGPVSPGLGGVSGWRKVGAKIKTLTLTGNVDDNASSYDGTTTSRVDLVDSFGNPVSPGKRKRLGRQHDWKTSKTTLVNSTSVSVTGASSPLPQDPNEADYEGLSSMERAIKRIAFLETELQSANKTILVLDSEINTLRVNHNLSVSKITQLDADLANAQQQVQQDKETITTQTERIARLRAQILEATNSSGHSIVDQSPLRVPETELINRWQALSYSVRNFVQCYLKGLSERKIKTWIDKKGDNLKEISPYYSQFAMENKAGIYMIQAAIWNVLFHRVFSLSTTHGALCWAGKCGKHLKRLSLSLHSAIKPGANEPKQKRDFHQWKAMTTSLMNTIGHSVNDNRDIMFDVTEDIEDLLEPFASKIRDPQVAQLLRNIVADAIALDEVFCGQQAWYQIIYPEKRHDCSFDDQIMVRTEEGSSRQAVRFVIRPGLCRIEEDGHKDAYGRAVTMRFALDFAEVWT